MTEAFPDRNDQLFGREETARQLTERAYRSGLTVLVGRPLMGKTWTLTEIARRLTESGTFLVGYHESKGAETSHLLYAVSDLYTRWLQDSSLREQAISLWRRHRDSLVPRIGQMVGTLFERLSKNVYSEGIAALVRTTFDGLAEIQRDLASGGIEMAPLPYDQALSLTNLVAAVSGRQIVLILDAWEKTPSLHSEAVTLEAFLKHLDAWPTTHIFLAVRHPQFASVQDDQALACAQDLCRISRSAEVCELAAMDLASPDESARLITFVQDRVTATRNLSGNCILAMIAGYPGVLRFWTHEVVLTAMRTEDDLQREADNAQAIRYLDLDVLLCGLSGEQCALAARFAFFPRLDSQRWATYRDLLLESYTDADVDSLIDAGVLNDERFPSYGHDTRHAAARSWYMRCKRPLYRRTAEQFVEILATRAARVESADQPYVQAMLACSETAREAGIDPVLNCLLDAAWALTGNDKAVCCAEFDRLSIVAVRRNPRLAPLIALTLNNRGVHKAHRGDGDGAMVDYHTAITLSHAPVEEVAIGYYNLSFELAERGDIKDAIDACDMCLDLRGGLSPAKVAVALNKRGSLKSLLGEFAGAIVDFTDAIGLPDISTGHLAIFLNNRGTTRGQSGDPEGAVNDFAAALALPDIPRAEITKALYGRGLARFNLGDLEAATTNFTAVIRSSNASAPQLSKAHFYRGLIRKRLGYLRTAVLDFTATMECPGVAAELLMHALTNRGAAKYLRGDDHGAIADCTALIQRPDAPVDLLITAQYNRGLALSLCGDHEKAVIDLTAIMEFPNAPAQLLEGAQKRIEELKTARMAEPKRFFAVHVNNFAASLLRS